MMDPSNNSSLNSLNTSKRLKQNTKIRNKDSYKASYNDKLNFHYDFSTGRSLVRNASDFSSVDHREDSPKDAIRKRYSSFIESQDNALRNKMNAKNAKEKSSK